MRLTAAKLYAKHLKGDGLDEYRIAYFHQRARAKRRGIGFELTFEQWREWWGADIDRRGTRKGDLCMQRIRDTGPYALGNIEKGDAQKNSDTRVMMKPIKDAIRAHVAHQSQLDAEMRSTIVRQGKRLDEVESEDQTHLRETLGYRVDRVVASRFRASARIDAQM